MAVKNWATILKEEDRIIVNPPVSLLLSGEHERVTYI